MKMKSVDDIRFSREMLEYEIDAFLRSMGWESTSHTPGCFWLWKKKLWWPTTRGGEPVEQMVMTDKNTALSIQQALDERDTARTCSARLQEGDRRATCTLQRGHDEEQHFDSFAEESWPRTPHPRGTP